MECGCLECGHAFFDRVQRVVRSGRFGPYVTDGTTNATLFSSFYIDTLSLSVVACP